MELKEIAKNVMVSCLAVKPTEDVLIITDDSPQSKVFGKITNSKGNS